MAGNLATINNIPKGKIILPGIIKTKVSLLAFISNWISIIINHKELMPNYKIIKIIVVRNNIIKFAIIIKKIDKEN